jgi:N6-L-threonylcarbamoyladenine synthase
VYILGIETSCDETAAAVLSHDFTIHSSVVLSQDEIHAPYGGIVPELASRQHIKSIGYVVAEGMSRAGLELSQIDAFAVTQGPGLIGSLLVGLSFAKGLAYTFGKALVPVDHLEAHFYSAFIENRDITFPALALLVSGGHTALYLLEKKRTYQLIGKTRDDAAGEALDKIAKFLELGYPGGPIIDRLSEGGDTRRFPFALPTMSDGSLDFSFSGYKTAALRIIKQQGIDKTHPLLKDFLASFEKSIIQALLSNLSRGIAEYSPESLILCGGVARNKKLRADFLNCAQEQGLGAYIPSPSLCTDNAAMIAALGIDMVASGKEVTIALDLNAYARR